MKSTDNKKARNLGQLGLIDCQYKEINMTLATIQQNQPILNNQPLVIGEFKIRQDEDGRYCINDLHKASGGADKHQPAFFMRNKQTKDLIEELESEFMICKNADHKMRAVNSVKGKGLSQGTFVVKELVYYYAMWISAKFHLMVIRAYDALISGQISVTTKTNKSDRVPLKDAVNMLVAKAQCLNYADAYKLVHQKFGVEHVEDISHDDLPRAVEYVHHLMSSYAQKVERIDPELRALELLDADITNKVHDYIYALHQEINRLKGNKPVYPEFDKETIVRAVVTRMMDQTRMVLTMNRTSGKPEVSFIPNNSWILTEDNISKIIGDPCGPKKEVLPNIIHAAASRLTK